MATMRAMVLKEPGPVEDRRLVMSELDIPEPRTHEILVRVTACGICRTDLHVVEGELEQRLPAIIPGHQIVGVVEQIGHGVSGIQVGERVGVAWLQGTCGACRHCLSS
ncbi:MAG: alcohol dehydrogenase catalytic domain-containing protein, partial [Pyrinomonadaceae bacterium]|nr:alcohol dehydrogenase catalytic domain-containing protein [Pyrinomonadaceae bacterium]